MKAGQGARLRQGFGATRCCGQIVAHIRFCETNPPFFDGIFDVRAYDRVDCVGNLKIILWVRFPKRTHFKGGWEEN